MAKRQKNRQHNGQKKKYKQRSTKHKHKTKDRVTYYSFIVGIVCITLQGDNSLKSVERFDHMMFVCRFQTSRGSKPQREKLLRGW